MPCCLACCRTSQSIQSSRGSQRRSSGLTALGMATPRGVVLGGRRATATAACPLSTSPRRIGWTSTQTRTVGHALRMGGHTTAAAASSLPLTALEDWIGSVRWRVRVSARVGSSPCRVHQHRSGAPPLRRDSYPIPFRPGGLASADTLFAARHHFGFGSSGLIGLGLDGWLGSNSIFKVRENPSYI